VRQDAPDASPPPRRRRRPPPLPFSAAAGGSPFAGLAKVDLAGARFRLVDARGQVLGRLATHVAALLQGKDRPSFDPSCRAGGDVCVVVNAEHAVLTGRKWEGKIYRHHTGRPGGLREETAAEAWRRGPARLVERAVAGMLPRSGAGRRDRLRKLRVFDGPDHPFDADGRGALEMVPSPPPPRVLRDKGRGWALPDGFEPMNPLAYARRMRGSGGRRGGGGGGVSPAPSGGADGRQPGFDDLLAAGEQEMVAAAAKAAAAAAGGARRGE